MTVEGLKDLAFRVEPASTNGGDPRHPAWFLNLRDNPDVEVTMGGRTRKMRARVASDEERVDLWPRITSNLGTMLGINGAPLESAFKAQRQFVANASHKLRTPLARQRAIIQVALTDPEATIESLRAAHERALVSGTQQEQLIDALLTLARSHTGLERREAFDLASVTNHVLLARQQEVEQRGLDVHSTHSLVP